MRTQFLDTYVTRYDRPFTAWLDQVVLDGGADNDLSFGDYWFSQIGKNVLVATPSGGVFSTKNTSSKLLFGWVADWFGLTEAELADQLDAEND